MYYKLYADIVDINQMFLYDLTKITGSAPRKIGILTSALTSLTTN